MKLGRNDPCHCGSGEKYKKCHLKADEATASAASAAQAPAPQARQQPEAKVEAPRARPDRPQKPAFEVRSKALPAASKAARRTRSV